MSIVRVAGAIPPGWGCAFDRCLQPGAVLFENEVTGEYRSACSRDSHQRAIRDQMEDKEGKRRRAL
jgi:hypothetical protein